VFVREKFKRQQILDEIEAIGKGYDDDILHEALVGILEARY